VKILDSSKLYFTADTHFGHKNIINFSERPYTNIDTMDDSLIRNWNSVVPPDGIIFHLGDFSFYNAQHSKWILEQLSGRIILIKGNHDKCTSYFKEVHNMLDIKVLDNINGNFGGYTNITLCHYPMAIWNKKHYGSFMFHGHSHGTYKPIENMSDHHFVDLPKDLFFKYNKIIDVGIDCWDFKPVSYADVVEKLING